jgi:hypothetical protein
MAREYDFKVSIKCGLGPGLHIMMTNPAKRRPIWMDDHNCWIAFIIGQCDLVLCCMWTAYGIFDTGNKPETLPKLPALVDSRTVPNWD